MPDSGSNLVPPTEISEEGVSKGNPLALLADKIYLHRLPSYANRIFYGLGFLTLTSLVLVILTGSIEAFKGEAWWLHSPLGIYVRSVHLWAVQAFIAMMLLHMLIGFLTSGFKPPRRFVWVIGATIFCLALIQTEFGYGLRGDFASQFRAASGADFWNGVYLGRWFNPLDYLQVFAVHVFLIPSAILGLFVCHYILIKTFGISKPYRSDVKYTMVAADHRIMYIRGACLTILILGLAYFFHSPYVPAVTVADVAASNPGLVATTLLSEADHSSGTATYLDSIDPYAFDTAEVFVHIPYEQARVVSGAADAWTSFTGESPDAQQADLAQAYAYATTTDPAFFASSTDPLIPVLNTLMPMASSGLYQSLIDQENQGVNSTYSLRFLTDMGSLEEKASTLHMDTTQWGMIKDETGSQLKLPPGSWWFLPLAVSNSIFDLPNNDNGDRIAGEILGGLMLIFILFPYIPFLNRLPELVPSIARFIWKS